jgi:predicted Rossmann fold flavoprotein
MFPDSNRARDVLDALMRETVRTGATLLVGRRVLEVTREADRFKVSTEAESIFANAVVLATGGQSLPKSGSDGAGFALAHRLGHSIVAPTPGLVPLTLGDPPLHRTLAGVAQDVELTIWIDGEAATRLEGALLWTHTGVSGPVAMNASRHWLRARLEERIVSITINLIPRMTFDTLDADWIALAAERPATSLENALATMVPGAVASALIGSLGLAGTTSLAHLTRESRRRLVHGLLAWPLPVTGTRGYNYAEVTAGGIALGEIDPATMESRVCPGLYLVGEILDVDGRIGGFNFQWAWSTGRQAGRALGLTGP